MIGNIRHKGLAALYYDDWTKGVKQSHLFYLLITTREQHAMTMKNPPHPGGIIRDLCISPLGLTVTQAAEGLGVTRKTLSLLLNGHAGISPEMAVRLSQSFGRSPESWLQLQLQYDLAQVRKSAKQIKTKRFFDAAAPQP
jgi:antitoxin HigA-1